MSCLGPFYNPIPPREWSRVQNQCSVIATNQNQNNQNSNVLIPLLGITVPNSSSQYYAELINKGNVLQYKKNSSNLTKNQRYSQIAKGMWTNRTKTWASQSQTYTNPNMTSLRRVNYVDVALPNGVVDPFLCPTNTYKDGGNLVCNQTVNPCTDEVIAMIPPIPNFYPTSDSDVPGKIQPLYWNNRIPTWYPRQRYTMNNSANKWPANSKFIEPANGFIPSQPRTTFE